MEIHYEELTKRGVTIVSFSGDGDSRVMKGMRITLPFPVIKTEPLLHLSINKSGVEIPASLKQWICIKNMPKLCCVQDIVHIGVKLKARMLKPSIILSCQWVNTLSIVPTFP